MIGVVVISVVMKVVVVIVVVVKVTGALVLHWLLFKHSYEGLRKSAPVAPFASYFGGGSGAAPGCSL